MSYVTVSFHVQCQVWTQVLRYEICQLHVNCFVAGHLCLFPNPECSDAQCSTKWLNELYSRFCKLFLWVSPRLPWQHGTRQQGLYISGTLRKQFPNLTAQFILFLSSCLTLLSEQDSSLTSVESRNGACCYDSRGSCNAMVKGWWNPAVGWDRGFLVRS